MVECWCKAFETRYNFRSFEYVLIKISANACTTKFMKITLPNVIPTKALKSKLIRLGFHDWSVGDRAKNLQF